MSSTATWLTHFFVSKQDNLIRFRWHSKSFRSVQSYDCTAGKGVALKFNFVELYWLHKIQGFHYKGIIFNGEFNSEDHRYNVLFVIFFLNDKTWYLNGTLER